MRTQYGEAFVGEGADAAHINTVLGGTGGPVETAWVSALATPRQGHAAFVVVAAPGIPVRPFTLFVNKATINDEQNGAPHGQLTWGAAQAGVAGGVIDAVSSGVIDQTAVDDLLLVVAVWVNPVAAQPEAVYANNREATTNALRNGRDGVPSIGTVLAAGDAPWNAYFTPQSSA
jgi:5,6,7,8-tetrahydromethanopterin hydro-lyase